jgi:hypothetical protein
VLDQIFSLRELLKVRRARDTALQQSRRRHAGVQYGESGEVVGWGWRRRRVDREDGKGLRLIFRSPAKTLNLWGLRRRYGIELLVPVERHSTVE